ncbi:hypothetical protein CAPTEDRAFT_136948, partial [Capitella teleta]
SLLQHGQIHDCLKRMILEQYNRDIWEKILKASNTDDVKHFLRLKHYDDELTLSLIKAAAVVLGLSLEGTLEAYGVYFIKYTVDMGYDLMLLSLGPDIRCFIENLDTVHTLLALSYKNIIPPIFRCESMQDGNLVLHYYSYREGLQSLVVGLLKGAADILHSTKVTVEILATQTFFVSESENLHHASLRVTLPEHLRTTSTLARHIQENIRQRIKQNGTGSCPFSNSGDLSVQSAGSINSAGIETKAIGCEGKDCTVVCPSGVPRSTLGCPALSPDNFCLLFPYHVVFDRHLVIKQCGNRLQNICPLVRVGSLMTSVSTIVYPRLPFAFHSILEFFNSVFVLHMIGGKQKQGVLLKGQMTALDQDHILYISTPKLRDLEELREKDIFLADIPVYDTMREFILLNQLRTAELDISLKLEETTIKLQMTAEALENEKTKSEKLLYQMLPMKVANALRSGHQVEAEKFEVATVLFSDIVTFTNIAAAVQPIDIVKMLNNLYSTFDQLTNAHNVYKVETIGDAYMVVSGLPEVSDRHAHDMANMALDMIMAAQRVNSPATGKPLQIRVGIHSGPVVAGVVGEKMPRYCLFGDTVNTASRMESHGQPGMIHMSQDTQRLLETSYYVTRDRGFVRIKGKGKMRTSFLMGKAGMVITSKKREEKDMFDGESITSSTDHASTNPSAAVMTSGVCIVL